MLGIISTSLSDISFVGTLSNALIKENLPFQLLLSGQHSYDFDLEQRASSILKIPKKNLTRYSSKTNSDDINIFSDSKSTIGDSIKFIEEYNIKNILISGDRYEMLLSCTLFSQMGCNLIHYGAGQISKGSKDDLYRKCISILCNYYLVSTNESKKKLIKDLKINPSKISITGSLGLDRINKFSQNNKIITIEGRLLIALHPEIKNNQLIAKLICQAIDYAYNVFKDKLKIVLSLPNNDYKSQNNQKIIVDFINSKKYSFEILSGSSDSYFIENLMSSHLIIGNSSSFVIEAPSLNKISLIVGSRQSGRESAKSVIHTFYDKEALFNAIDFAIRLNNPRNVVKEPNLFTNPYWHGGACTNIIKSLVKWNCLIK